MSADSAIEGTTGWAERDAEIHKLKTQHAYEANGLRALLQNERDNMNAALLEIDRLKTVIGEMTINQRIQDSTTAAVMERAEKAEAEAEVFKSLYLNEQGRCEALRVDAERYQWLRKQAHPTSPESFWVARGGYGPAGISIWWLESLDAAIDAAIDAARGTAAWKDVQNASKWVDELRGGSDTAMGK
jgi:hypothetical protein